MLPSFIIIIIIGAMKAGKSSLYRYLDAHPQIGMSYINSSRPADTSFNSRHFLNISQGNKGLILAVEDLQADRYGFFRRFFDFLVSSRL